MALEKINYAPGDILTSEQMNKIQDAIIATEGNIEQHFDDENPHNLTPEMIGATETVLLWENASPGSEFAAQTIALDFSQYDFLLLNAVGAKGGWPSYRNFIVAVDGLKAELTICAINEVKWVYRNFTASADGLVCSEGGLVKYNTTTATNNSNFIPLKIYGIKGVS